MGSTVSFKLGTFTGGAGLAEGDYLLRDHSVVLWDYDGKMSGNTLALRVAAQPVQVSGKNFTPVGEESLQYYSIGDPVAFSPDPTGKKIVAIGNRATLGKGSNFFIYLENLVNAGFPEDRMNDDMSTFDGMVVHITPIPAPQRNLPQSNLVQSANPQQQRDRTIPVVSHIHKYPWEAGGPTGKAAPAPAKAKAAAAAAAAPVVTSGDPIEVLTAHLGAVLNGAASVGRTQARVNTFKAMNKVDVPTRNAVMQLFNNDEELSAVLAGVGEGYYLEGIDIKKIG